jgi:hypothetical protein
MDAAKRKAVEAVGWKLGDAADFLELSEAERQSLDARVGRALADKDFSATRRTGSRARKRKKP